MRWNAAPGPDELLGLDLDEAPLCGVHVDEPPVAADLSERVCRYYRETSTEHQRAEIAKALERR